MEQLPLITESVQYGVIGICIVLIVALVIIIRLLIGLNVKLLERMDSLEVKFDTLNDNIGDLTSTVKMFFVQARMWSKHTKKTPPAAHNIP